jgi:SAM-dependent methyltransferase
MQVFNSAQNLLVCHDTDAQLLLSTYLRDRRVFQLNGLRVFDIGEDVHRLGYALAAIPGLKARRYLDRFHLWTPDNNPRRRQEVLDRFFAFIADQYESLIDVERNLDNIRILLGFLNRLMGPIEAATIVDYGCGTGLSRSPASEFKVELVGVDRCPTMRRIASDRGMTTWGPGVLARQPKNSIDGALASYVFHLLPHSDGLRLLWARLKPGGMLVANFHKNQGMELVEACVREGQGLIHRLESPAGSERHGSYVAYLKEE